MPIMTRGRAAHHARKPDLRDRNAPPRVLGSPPLAPKGNLPTYSRRYDLNDERRPYARTILLENIDAGPTRRRKGFSDWIRGAGDE